VWVVERIVEIGFSRVEYLDLPSTNHIDLWRSREPNHYVFFSLLVSQIDKQNDRILQLSISGEAQESWRQEKGYSHPDMSFKSYLMRMRHKEKRFLRRSVLTCRPLTRLLGKKTGNNSRIFFTVRILRKISLQSTRLPKHKKTRNKKPKRKTKKTTHQSNNYKYKVYETTRLRSLLLLKRKKEKKKS